MYSGSSGLDNTSSTDETELTEFSRSSDGYSDSGSSADFTSSCRRSIKQRETEGDEVNDVAITFLSTSHEIHHVFDIEGAPEDLTRIRRSSSDPQANVLTREVSSLEGLSNRRVRSLDPLKGTSTKMVSSMDSLKGPSIRRLSSPEGPSIRRVLSLDPLGLSTKMVSSMDSLRGPSIRRVSSLDPLEGPSTRRVSSLDPLEGPSTRTVWFSDSAEGSLASICKSHNSETETEMNEPSHNELPIEQNGYWSRALAWLRSFLRRYSRQIRHSKYYSLFHVALLTIPCSAGYMGSKYHNLCDGCPKLPFLVFMLGLFGMFIIITRIAAILSRRYFSPPLTGREFNSWMVSICLTFFLFLLIEIVTTCICEPVFIPPHQEFCLKAFYNYAYYLNGIVLLVILLLMLIHIPSCFDPAEDE